MNFNLVEQREDRNNEWIKKAHTKEGRKKMVLCSEDPGPDTRLRPARFWIWSTQAGTGFDVLGNL